MGYNTTVVILNDAIHQIKDDPEFGKNLHDAVLGLALPEKYRSRYVPSGHHCNAAEVIEHHHADGIKLVAVGANTGWDLEVEVHYTEAHKPGTALQEVLLRALADKLGYRVARKPQSRRRR